MDNFCVARIVSMLLSLCGVMGAPASAQQWPTKPVRFIVPFPSGQAADIATRLLAEPLTVALGQQVVVENRPGAGTMIGTQMVAKSPPDGYTILAGGSSALVISPHVYKNAGYDTLRDFAPITKINITAFVFCVNPSFPAKSIPELIALAKRRPGEITYGTAGLGSAQHLTQAMFAAAAGVTLTHVPYKGGAVASIIDLIGGQISLIAETTPAVLPHVKAGKIRPIGASTAKRISFLPDVATLQEQGIKDFEVTGWTGIVAPAGTPEPILARLSTEILKILSTPEIIKRYYAAGMELGISSREHFGATLKKEHAMWAKAVNLSGVSLE